MQELEFFKKTDFVLSRNAEDNCGQLIRLKGCRSVLVIYGRKYAPRSGVLERISRSLDRAGLEHFELGGVISNPRVDTVRAGIALCEEHRIDFILAVGGGSVIDSAKAIAGGMYLQGDVWDLFLGKKTMHRAIALGVILTFLGSGSECSQLAVLTNDNEDGKRVRRILQSELLVPSFCLLNPKLTFSLSPKATANGAVSMLCHIMARYLLAPKGSQAVMKIMGSLMVSIIDALRRSLNDPSDYDARSDLMWAEMMTFEGIISSSMHADFCANKLEYALSDYRDKPYGNVLSLIMPAYLRFILPNAYMRLAQFANEVLGVPLYFEDLKRTAQDGIAAWYALMQEFGLPTSFKDLNLTPADIPKICDLLPLNEEGTLGTLESLDRASCEAIYTLAALNYKFPNFRNYSFD